MARSGSPYSTPRDANHVPLLVVASTVDGITPVVLEADPTTHALVTSGSSTGGTQYTDGAAAVTHPVGTQPVFTNASGTVTAVSSTNGLPVNSLNAELPDVTGTITNATQTTPIVASGLAGYDNVFITINGTYAGATAIFQGSDDGGTTWYNTNVAARVDTPVVEGGYTNLTNISRAWNLNIQGFDTVRVNPSAVATGTVNVRISPESAPTNAGATIQASITDGTNTASILKSDGTAAGQNSQLVAGGFMGVAFTTTTAQAVGTTDIANYSWISVHITTQGGSSSVAFQGSNDNTNWVNTSLSSAAGTANSVTSTSTAAIVYAGPRNYRYFRLNVTGIVSGTTAGTIEFFALAPSPIGIGTVAAQSGTWTVGANSATGSAVPANAFYAAGINSSGSLTGMALNYGADGQGASTSLAATPFIYNGTNWDRLRSGGVTGMMGVSIQASPTGAFTYGHVSTAATTTLKSGAGTLHNVSVNTLGTVASTATIYDSTTGSGTVIGVINTLNLSGSFILDVAFTTGLTIVTTGTIAPDLTVSYK